MVVGAMARPKKAVSSAFKMETTSRSPTASRRRHGHHFRLLWIDEGAKVKIGPKPTKRTEAKPAAGKGGD